MCQRYRNPCVIVSAPVLESGREGGESLLYFRSPLLSDCYAYHQYDDCPGIGDGPVYHICYLSSSNSANLSLNTKTTDNSHTKWRNRSVRAIETCWEGKERGERKVAWGQLPYTPWFRVTGQIIRTIAEDATIFGEKFMSQIVPTANCQPDGVLVMAGINHRKRSFSAIEIRIAIK
jgi:hypothetical protein